MDRFLLDDLQRRRTYPSVTILVNTTRRSPLDDVETHVVRSMILRADERLVNDTGDDVRTEIVQRLHALLAAHREQPASVALALCASTEVATVVRLGLPVRQRVVIDDTFATRDLVADLNRTAEFRLVVVSEPKVKVLLGDRQRLVEQCDDHLPLLREDGEPMTLWSRRVDAALRSVHAGRPLPTILAGVDRSLRTITAVPDGRLIGKIPGSHDRTSWSQLHAMCWPLVIDWLRADRRRALVRLNDARSSALYAGGIDEVYALASEGRVALVVVEEGFELPVRVRDDAHLEPALDRRDEPGVVDDIVDDSIELVLQRGGEAVMVDDGDLDREGRIAAVLRY